MSSPNNRNNITINDSGHSSYTTNMMNTTSGNGSRGSGSRGKHRPAGAPPIYSCACSNVTITLDRTINHDKDTATDTTSSTSGSDGQEASLFGTSSSSSAAIVGILASKSIEQRALVTARSMGDSSSPYTMFRCSLCRMDVFALAKTSNKVVLNARLRFGDDVQRLRASDDFSPAFGLVIRRGLADPSSVDNGLLAAPDPSLSRQLERALTAERIAMDGRISKYQHEEMEKFRSFEMRAKAELSELTSAIRESDHDQKTPLAQFASSSSTTRSSPSSSRGSPQTGTHSLLSGVRASPSGIAFLPQLLPSNPHSNSSSNISTLIAATTSSDTSIGGSSTDIIAATSTAPSSSSRVPSSRNTDTNTPSRPIAGSSGSGRTTNQIRSRNHDDDEDDEDDDGLFEFDEDTTRVSGRTATKYNDDRDDDNDGYDDDDDGSDADPDEEHTDFKKDFGLVRSPAAGTIKNVTTVRRDYPMLSSSIPVEIPRFGHKVTVAPAAAPAVTLVAPVADDSKAATISPTLAPRPSPKVEGKKLAPSGTAAAATGLPPSTATAAARAPLAAAPPPLAATSSSTNDQEDSDDERLLAAGRPRDLDGSDSDDDRHGNTRRDNNDDKDKAKSRRFMPPHTLTEESFWSFAKVEWLPEREVSHVMKVTQLDTSSATAPVAAAAATTGASSAVSSSIAIGAPFTRTDVSRARQAGPSLLSRSLR